jgi:hypothetical protein
MILNAGSTVATPGVWKELAYHMRTWDTCNDQLIYNVWTYATSKNDTTLFKVNNGTRINFHFHDQGTGAMNVVGYISNTTTGAFLKKDRRDGRFLNRNCVVSPVVHQFDKACRYEKDRCVI